MKGWYVWGGAVWRTAKASGFGERTTWLYDFVYDNSGNMTERQDYTASNTYTQDFDIENRLIQVTQTVTTTVTTFDYDDAGQRTKATMEQTEIEQRVIYYPFPNYEVEHRLTWNPGCIGLTCGYWELEDTITRKMYSAGGQAIATRVSGDPVSANNGLFYFHSDHLGSATFLTHGNGHANDGLKVANSTKFYTPFGEYRIEPPSPTDDITDRGYTGHKHGDEIGLIYMNARYYVNTIGRFASADTLIPYPTDPQSHDRFSYVLNNPLNLVDPTGHIPCPDPDAGCAPANTPPPDITQEEYEDTIIAAFKEERSGSSHSESEPLIPTFVCGYAGGTQCRFVDLKPTQVPEGCIPLNSGGYMCPPEGGWDPYYPSRPEYFKFSYSASIGIGGGTSIIIDIYGNMYLSVDGQIGLPGFGMSDTVGFVKATDGYGSGYYHVNPDEETLENILTGSSIGGYSGGFIGGYNVAFTNYDGTSYATVDLGFYFPLQFSLYTFNLKTWQIYDAQNDE